MVLLSAGQRCSPITSVRFSAQERAGSRDLSAMANYVCTDNHLLFRDLRGTRCERWAGVRYPSVAHAPGAPSPRRWSSCWRRRCSTTPHRPSGLPGDQLVESRYEPRARGLAIRAVDWVDQRSDREQSVGSSSPAPGFRSSAVRLSRTSSSATISRASVDFVSYGDESDAGAPGLPGYPIPDEARTQPHYIEGDVAGGDLGRSSPAHHRP